MAVECMDYTPASDNSFHHGRNGPLVESRKRQPTDLADLPDDVITGSILPLCSSARSVQNFAATSHRFAAAARAHVAEFKFSPQVLQGFEKNPAAVARLVGESMANLRSLELPLSQLLQAGSKASGCSDRLPQAQVKGESVDHRSAASRSATAAAAAALCPMLPSHSGLQRLKIHLPAALPPLLDDSAAVSEAVWGEWQQLVCAANLARISGMGFTDGVDRVMAGVERSPKLGGLVSNLRAVLACLGQVGKLQRLKELEVDMENTDAFDAYPAAVAVSKGLATAISSSCLRKLTVCNVFFWNPETLPCLPHLRELHVRPMAEEAVLLARLTAVQQERLAHELAVKLGGLQELRLELVGLTSRTLPVCVSLLQQLPALSHLSLISNAESVKRVYESPTSSGSSSSRGSSSSSGGSVHQDLVFNPRLRSLHLDGHYFTQWLPDSCFSNLSCLSSLQINDLHIGQRLPASVGDISSLQQLKLSVLTLKRNRYSQQEELQQATWAGLHSLTRLEALVQDGESLAQELESLQLPLSGLREAVLGSAKGTPIQRLPRGFEGMGELRDLELCHVDSSFELSSEVAAGLSFLTRLVINQPLRFPRESPPIVPIVARIPSLKVLHFSGVEKVVVMGEGVAADESLGCSLEELRVSLSTLVTWPTSSVPLQQLRRLQVSVGKQDFAGEASQLALWSMIQDMPQLESLTVEGVRHVPKNLGEVQSLKTLSMVDCGGFPEAAFCPNLESLHVEGLQSSRSCALAWFTPKLSHLRLKKCSAESIAGHFFSHPSLKAINIEQCGSSILELPILLKLREVLDCTVV